MDVRTFPVLTDEDEALVARLSVGLGENAARVLAYLLGRRADPDLSDAAARTAVHIGAGVSRNAAADALDELAGAGLLAETTATTAAPGRPPKAWHAVDARSGTIRRTYARHADRLLERGERYVPGLEPGADEPDPGSAADRPARDGVAVGLNWAPNALHLPLFAASAADAGAGEMSFEQYEGSRAAADAVASGACDVAVAGAATILRERARGRSIVPIAVLFQRSTVVLYTTRAAFGGPFESVAALRGRRVGMPSGTETGLLGRLLLEQADLRDAVEVVTVDGEERAPLRSGAVDAVTGMGPDPARLESTGRTVEAVALADAYPAYGPALIANEAALRRRRPLLKDVLIATMAGWADAVDEPSAAAREFAAETDESPERIARTFERAVDRFGTSDVVRRRGWGWHSPERWRDLRNALTQGGILEDD